MADVKIDIRHIAKLSRLELGDDKIEQFERDMRNIVEMAQRLPHLDENLALDEHNVMKLREDIAKPCGLTREELFANAPQVKAGCIVVPKTVE